MYNGVMRALQLLGLADVYGSSAIPLYVMNVTYPLVDDEIVAFCAGKRAVLMVEEGQPEYIEQSLNTILRRRDLQTASPGKDVLPMARRIYRAGDGRGHPPLPRDSSPGAARQSAAAARSAPVLAEPKVKALDAVVPPRPPGFCTGCPERPIFAAMKLVEKELGQHHVAADIGCHLFSILPPFNIGATTMGYGLGPPRRPRSMSQRASARSRSWATAASGITA